MRSRPQSQRAPRSEQDDDKIQQCSYEPGNERKAKQGDHRDRNDHTDDHGPETMFDQG